MKCDRKMFVPLRIHSVYSRGKGSATLDEVSTWVSRKGIEAAALTDIENLYGWAKWRRAAEARGFRPLFGCELKIGGRQFVFLVKSREGYWNLMEIFNHKGRRSIEEGEGKARAQTGNKVGGPMPDEGKERGEKTVRLTTDGLITIFVPKLEDIDLPPEFKRTAKNRPG